MLRSFLRLRPDWSCVAALRDSSEAADLPCPVRSLVLATGDDFAPARAIGPLVCGLTFELRGRRRQDARPGPVKIYRVPPARAWWPAVGAPFERGVRQHSCGAMTDLHFHALYSASCCAPGQEKPQYYATGEIAKTLLWRSALCCMNHEVGFLASIPCPC